MSYMNCCVLLLLLLLTSLHPVKGHLRSEEQEVITGVTDNLDSLTLKLSRAPENNCQSLIILDLTSQMIQCNIRKLEIQQNSVECVLPLITLNSSNLEEESPQKKCLVKCGAYCRQSSLINRVIAEQAPVFSFEPTSGSFVYPSYLTISLPNSYDNIESVYLQNQSNTIVNAFILKQYPKLIKTIIKGGTPGDYTVKLKLLNGQILQSTSTFAIKTKVLSLQPTEGTINGGVILKIQCENCSPRIEENKVTIGSASCRIILASPKLITCIIEVDPAKKPQISIPLTVVISSGEYHSESDPSTRFTFVDYQIAPAITQIGSNIKGIVIQGETVVVYGTNLRILNETTVLRIGEDFIDISSLTQSQLNFTVPFDMLPKKQPLKIYVGQYGSTESIDIFPSIKLLSSQCLKGGTYNLQLSQRQSHIFIDMNLSNYDPTYPLEITLNDQKIDQITVFQSTDNKNQITIDFLQSYIEKQTINAIRISEIDLIEAPIPLNFVLNENEQVITDVSFEQGPIEGLFLAIIKSDYSDLLISQIFLQNRGEPTVSIQGTAQSGYPLQFSFQQISTQIEYYFFLQGCSNKGSFNYQIMRKQLIKSAIYQGSQIWELVNSPFPEGNIFPGQQFKAHFYDFDLKQNVLSIMCSYYYDGLRSLTKIRYLESKSDTGNNTHIFEIPQFPQQISVSTKNSSVVVLKNCTLSLKKMVAYSNYLAYLNSSRIDFPVQFQKNNIIEITSITPAVISYLGGEEIVLAGKGLKDTSIDKVLITISGVPCNVVETTLNHISCTSGFYSHIQSLPISLEDNIIIYQNGVKATINCTATISFRLVDPIPLLGITELKDNTDLYIPHGSAVIMDDPEQLSDKILTYDNVLIEGQWIFESNMNFQIICNKLLGQGMLVIGSKEHPFVDKKMSFTVKKVLSLKYLKAFGDSSSSIVNISDSAYKGQKTLKVTSNIISQQGFRSGDQILISGTTLGSKEEKLTIEQVNADSLTVTTALEYDHICIDENILLKDSTTAFHFQVSPSIIRISKTVVMNLLDTSDVSITNSVFVNLDVHGVEVNYQRIHIRTFSIFININASKSVIGLSATNSGSSPSFAYLRLFFINLEQSLVYFDYKIVNLSGVAKNNIFIGKKQFDLVVGYYNKIELISNVFQGIAIYLIWQDSDDTFIKDNTIYNTEKCLSLLKIPYKEVVEQNMILSNNKCSSCMTAFSIAPNSFFKANKYSLIAVDIRNTAIQINSLKSEYYGENCYQCQIQSNYTLIEANMIFKQALNGAVISESTPYLFYMNISDTYQTIGLSNVEFIGFQGQLVGSKLSSFENLLQLKQIKNSFTLNTPTFDSGSQLIIHDIDGSFTGNNNKRINLFQSSLNLSSTSSCVVGQQPEMQICQNYLLHFNNQQLLANYENSSQTSILKLKRSNGQVVKGSNQGFFVVSGEVYEAIIEDEIGNARQFQTVSLCPDYSQNEQLAVVINYPIQSGLSTYFVANVSISSTSQLTSLSPNSILIQSESALSIQNCTHGQNYRKDDFVQVCYKSLSIPLTLQFTSFPDVIPSKSEDIEVKVRIFDKSESWLDDSGKTTQTSLRWTIQPRWNMVLSKGGVYDLPGLVVQGNLEITGNEDIVINSKGIYIGAGVIKVASEFTGKLFFNFIITDVSEVIFRNPYQGGQKFYQGTFMVNNKLIIENKESSNNILQYRVKTIIDDAKVLLEENSTQFQVGDEVLFACPITGQTLLTTIKELASGGSGTTIVFNESHGYSLQSFESFTVSSSKFNLSPYLSNSLNKRIKISNANIIVENFLMQFIPSITISGVQFENSSVTLNHGIGSISINSSVFLDKSATLSSSKEFYISINQLYNYYLDKLMNPSIKIAKNLFFSRNIAVQSNAMVDVYLNEQIINPIPTNEKSNLILEFNENFIAKVSTAVTSLTPFNLFSKNIILKATDSGIASSECFSVSLNVFYYCTRVAIDMPKCSNVIKNIVAMSGAVYSSQVVTQIWDLVSIGNQQLQYLPIQLTDLSILPKLKLAITRSYFIGDLSLIVSPNGICTPKKTLIPLFTASNTASLSVPEVLIMDSFFAYFKCTKIIDIPENQYLASLTFINSQCLNCLYNNLSDVFGVPSTLSLSFLAQDYQSKFFSSLPFVNSQDSDQSIIITSSQGSLSLKKVPAPNLLARLFISQLQKEKTPQTFTAEETPTYNTQVLSDQKGAILILTLNKLYSLTSSTILEKNVFKLSSPNVLSKEYIQIKYKPQDGNGLLIQKSLYTLPTSTGLDSSNGFNILNLVSNNESKISCGTNTYDNTKNEYYIVITNDEDCLIRIFEYATPKISIVISTPILPSPPAGQENMCLAERQRLYIIEKLSVALGVSKKRIRIILQSNSGSCSQATRILTENETLSITFVVDSEANSSDSVTDNCLLNPNCSTEQRNLQIQASQADSLNTIYASANIQETALSQGLIVSSVQTVLPSLSTQCTGNTPFQLDLICVSSCSAGYFAQGQICIKCHMSCHTCTGQLEYGCAPIVSNSGLASLDCTVGYQTFTENSSNKKYCGKCPANCSTCLQQKCPSSSCNQGFTNQNGNCLLACLSGYFSNEGVCIQCLPQCKNSCSSGTCICSDGFYFKSSSGVPSCNTCPQQCATCSSDNICLTCSEAKNEPKHLCVTEKSSGSKDSQNDLPLIIGVVSGVLIAIVVIGVVVKIALNKKKVNLAKQQKELNTISAKEDKADVYQAKKDSPKVIQLEINSEELIPLD